MQLPDLRTVRVLALCAAGLLAACRRCAGADFCARRLPPLRLPDAPALYQQHCAACHAPQRTGAMGPALLPESLSACAPPRCCA